MSDKDAAAPTKEAALLMADMVQASLPLGQEGRPSEAPAPAPLGAAPGQEGQALAPAAPASLGQEGQGLAALMNTQPGVLHGQEGYDRQRLGPLAPPTLLLMLLHTGGALLTRRARDTYFWVSPARPLR